MKRLIGIVFILFASIVQSADLEKVSDATTTFEKWQLAEEAKEQAKELRQAEQAKALKLRAERGDADAQYYVGSMYLYKQNNKNKNNKQAVYWFRKAAEQGIVGAQNALARMYFYGLGALQNYKQAVHWFRKAAEQGNEDAQKELGSMYANGEGVLQDYKKGYMWFNLARYNGADTKEGFEEIIPKMTSKSINEAQEMSKKCLDSNYDNCG